MKNTMTTDLRFVIGVMHGYINRHDRKLYPSLKSVGKEDIEQTILLGAHGPQRLHVVIIDD